MLSSSRLARCRPVLFTVALAACLTASAVAEGQVVRRYYGAVPRYNWGWYSPVDALASRVHAQADLIRAGGAASVDYAAAREIRARAVRQEIENSVDRVKAYWERKSIGEAERLKRAFKPLEHRKKVNRQLWDRIKNHPEMTTMGIENGNMLNHLLHRISASVLAYEFTKGDAVQDPEVLAELTLTPEQLADLKLRQVRKNGQNLVFSAAGGQALDTTWWPFVLRDTRTASPFTVQRKRFERARQRVVSEAAGGGIGVDALEELDEALLELRQAFDQHFTYERRHTRGMQSWHDYKTADAFLKNLVGEVGRLRSTGDSSAFDGSKRFEGDNLLELIKFMSSHGLVFAPATPGSEAAYHDVFRKMRELYITVAAETGDEPAEQESAEQ